MLKYLQYFITILFVFDNFFGPQTSKVQNKFGKSPFVKIV